MLPSYLVFMSNHKIKKQKIGAEMGVEMGVEKGVEEVVKNGRLGKMIR